ncbi:hypothetical protein [Bacillus massiliigorillae]|uniref:hypothetical protein n=1 Tax=Bacillus massiliigorillae TaxID=1243664 RepID=UPI00039B64F7|nr:hypothetical protein [Bacillus massiliigorillae]
MKNLVKILLVIFTWMFSILFLILQSNGMMNISPWGIHNFFTISVQILLIFLPIIGLIFAIFIKTKII